MTDTCTKCGRTKSQIAADAKTLGSLQEFQSGVYTCCQIVAWAEEQSLAWSEAAQQDCSLVDDDIAGQRQFDERDVEGVLVPVRLRRPQVPWYRHS